VCGVQCPLECSKKSFTAQAEDMIIQSDTKSLKPRLTVKIYYAELDYNESTEVPVMTLKYLLVSTFSILIGTCIFLGTGFSLVSFLEILEMLLEVTSILILKQSVKFENSQ
jgi:hypothetical protein